MNYLKVKMELLESALEYAHELPKDDYYTIYIDEITQELFTIKKQLRQS